MQAFRRFVAAVAVRWVALPISAKTVLSLVGPAAALIGSGVGFLVVDRQRDAAEAFVREASHWHREVHDLLTEIDGIRWRSGDRLAACQWAAVDAAPCEDGEASAAVERVSSSVQTLARQVGSHTPLAQAASGVARRVRQRLADHVARRKAGVPLTGATLAAMLNDLRGDLRTLDQVIESDASLDRSARLDWLADAALLFGLFGGVGGGFLVHLLSGTRIAQRLARIEARARELGYVRPDTAQAGEDEIARLARVVEQSAQSLKESEARYRRLVADLRDVVFELDADGRWGFLNPAWTTLTGHPIDRCIGRPAVDFVHPDDRASFAGRVRATLAGSPVPELFECRLETAAHGPVWVDVLTYPTDAADRSAGVSGTLRDVTARKEAERQARMFTQALEQRVADRTGELERANSALRELEGRLRDILEHSTNLFYAHTSDHVLTYVSPQSRTFFDCEPEEALVRWTEFVTNRPENAIGMEATSRAIETGCAQPAYELELRTVTGRLLWVEVNEAPVVRDGRTVAIVGSLTDITARKHAETEKMRLEAQVLQAQKLEAVGRLAGGVAHDFNNLLGVINGYSELLVEDLSPDDPRRSDASAILDAGQRAARLTRQLLAFSRRQALQPRESDLNEVVSHSEKMLRRLLREDITLRVVPGRDLGMVFLDPGQLDQVILNLAVNARDAMPGGGTLTIETSSLMLTDPQTDGHCELAPGRYALLTVSDTGCGMAADTQAHIFEPFFTTKGPERGTGLGLATVYGIVRQSRGHITVSSKVGSGTRFTLYFPCVSTAAHAPHAATAEGMPRAAGETILLVEDNAPLRELTRRSLEALGYRVLVADDGLSGLAAAEQATARIDLLMTDVVMPGMTGPRLAQLLLARRPDLKVLYMSGYAEDTLHDHGLLDADIMLLIKPFDQRTLRERLQTALRRSTPPAQNEYRSAN